MSLTTSRPTRFDAATVRKLQALAQKHRVKVSLLIRAAVSNALPDWEKNGIKLGRN